MNAREHRRQATRTSSTAPACAPARATARRLIAITALVGGAAAAGCGSSAPHGSPKLLQVYWETRSSAQTLAWTSIPADAEVPKAVPPGATQFDLVFDRVIDGSKVEDTVTVNGVSRQQPKAMPPVTVAWQGMGAPTDPGFYLSVWYNSIHLPPAPQNSSYVYGRQAASNPFASGDPSNPVVTAKPSSYPSNTLISICINPNGITSEYDELMAALPPEMSSPCPVTDGPSASWPAITVMTAPFAVAINPPPGAVPGMYTPPSTAVYVPTNFAVPLQFNNLTVDAVTQLSQYVEVRQNGAVLGASEYSLQASVSDPTLIFLQPASGKIWDSGVQLDVTLSSDLKDIYGATLGTAQGASFIPCQLLGEDAGVRICAPPIHPNGGTDGGAADASDGPASVDASSDAPDAGVDVADAADDSAVDAASD